MKFPFFKNKSDKLPNCEVNAKEALENVISVYEQGLYQLKLKGIERAVDFINTAEQKLSEMKLRLATVTDVGSKTAAECERTIFNCLQSALKDAFSGRYDISELSHFDLAFKEIDVWASIKISKKSKSAKAGEILGKTALPGAIVATAIYPLKKNKVAELKAYLKHMEMQTNAADATERNSAITACNMDFISEINRIVDKIEQYTAFPVYYCYLADNLNVDLIIDYMKYPTDAKKLEIMAMWNRVSAMEQAAFKAISKEISAMEQAISKEEKNIRLAGELLAKRKQMQDTEATSTLRTDKNDNIDDN